MAAYAVMARIDRVDPRLAGHPPASVPAWPVMEPADAPQAIDLVGQPRAPGLTERWMDLREAWAQTTFYLFSADGWR